MKKSGCWDAGDDSCPVTSADDLHFPSQLLHPLSHSNQSVMAVHPCDIRVEAVAVVSNFGVEGTIVETKLDREMLGLGVTQRIMQRFADHHQQTTLCFGAQA